MNKYDKKERIPLGFHFHLLIYILNPTKRPLRNLGNIHELDVVRSLRCTPFR